MKTIMTLVLVAMVFCGMTVYGDEPAVAPAPSTTAVQAPVDVNATLEQLAKTQAEATKEAFVQGGLAAVTPRAPARTWSGFAYDAANATASSVKWGACQLARGACNLDGAAAAVPGEVGTYVGKAAFDAATVCDAASR